MGTRRSKTGTRSPRAAAALAVFVLASLPLSASAQDGAAGDAPPIEPGRWTVERPEVDTLRVLVWNIQRGANNFDRGPEKALALIRDLAPDVCLLQESYDIEDERSQLGIWVAEQIGMTAHQGDSPHLCILTRLEVLDTVMHEPWHLVGAKLRDERGRELLACSIWIDYRAYTPYALRDDPGATDEDLLLNETERSGRLNQTRSILDFLDESGWLGAQQPLIVGGDWNCPSDLDWTAHTELVYRFRRSLPLPVSGAMHEAGFTDAFRMVHPDPVRAPGITWSPLYIGSAEAPGTADRIDRLYIRQDEPALHPVQGVVLPRVHEDPSIPQAQRAFPSDHAAVVIDFRWSEPAGSDATPRDP